MRLSKLLILIALTALVIPCAFASDLNDTGDVLSDGDVLKAPDSDSVISDDNDEETSADLKVVKSVSDSNPTRGETITWTISLSNLGPGIARDVVVSEDLSDNLDILSDAPSRGTYVNGIWSVGTLSPSETVTLTLTTRVSASQGNIQNNVFVNSTTYDPDQTNNYDSLNITIKDNSTSDNFQNTNQENESQNRTDNSSSLLSDKTSISSSKHITANPVVLMFLAMFLCLGIRRKR